jgi:GrpB-like predicted nucleotidyltransferase (UPF0157 family)
MKIIKCTNTLVRCCLPLLAFAAMLLTAPVSAHSQTMQPQSTTPQTQTPMQATTPPGRDDDATQRQLASFDSFLDSHPEIAEQLRKDPSLVNNQQFVAQHPGLQDYLTQHPELREEISQNPNAFMHQEERYDRGEDRNRGFDITRTELVNMDRFMDTHPEIAEQLRKDPSLVDNKQFVQNHPPLQQFLADHPGVREEYKEHPEAFMHAEERFDRREDRDRGLGITRTELVDMEQFMNSHPEIAEQLRKDPSLVDNKQFVESHPGLQQFLADHPGVREEYKEHPDAFMRDEERFDRREDRDHPRVAGELASFNDFLGSHDRIAAELSKNPSLANNQEYLENRPELRDYLKANPQVHQELSENPGGFIKAAQQSDTRGTPKMTGEIKPNK